MMRAVALFSAVLISWHGVQAQTLLVLPTDDPPEAFQWNPLVLSRNHITAIKGTLWTKREGEPMRQRNEQYVYRFDQDGKLTYSNTLHGGPSPDTASVTYAYNDRALPMLRLYKDLQGTFAYELKWDENGRLTHQTYVRMALPGSERTVISQEERRYALLNDTVLRTTTYNDQGRAYLETDETSDEYGYLSSVRQHYVVTGRTNLTLFSYDEQGRLRERCQATPDDGSPRTCRTWRYDLAGNVVASTVLMNGAPTTEEEYLYDERTLLLRARISKELATGLIRVVKFEVEKK
jgi:hypothetical protein